jgi:hypothetical protein
VVRAFGDGALWKSNLARENPKVFFGKLLRAAQLLLYNLWNSRISGVRFQRVAIPTAV